MSLQQIINLLVQYKIIRLKRWYYDKNMVTQFIINNYL